MVVEDPGREKSSEDGLEVYFRGRSKGSKRKSQKSFRLEQLSMCLFTEMAKPGEKKSLSVKFEFGLTLSLSAYCGIQ